jgi:two-component SAPR family response regulator
MHRLADALFPDKDADVAQDTLRVSLQRLRKLLGGEIHVPLREGRVSLDPATVWVDAVLLQQAFAEHDTAAASALELYRGPLLPDEEAMWAIAPRDKLAAAFLRHAGRRAQASEVGGQWIDAFHWYDRCAEVDPLNEGYCQGILRCSLALGRVAEGESAAQRTELAIAKAFRRPLSETTQRLWKELRSS